MHKAKKGQGDCFNIIHTNTSCLSHLQLCCYFFPDELTGLLTHMITSLCAGQLAMSAHVCLHLSALSKNLPHSLQ